MSALTLEETKELRINCRFRVVDSKTGRVLIISVPWLSWRFISEDYGLAAAGVFLGVIIMDASMHLLLLL